MIKVYNLGVNVCIEGHPDASLYFIPTHQSRLDFESGKAIIIDTYSNRIDRFIIPLNELEDNDGNTYPTQAQAIAYLSEFVGKSYCCSENSTDEPLNQTFTYNNSDRLIYFNDPVRHSVCFTYGGYHEANFGLGECNGWVRPGIGGQQ